MLGVIIMWITITIPTCGTIHFLVDDCLGLFFITVGTWNIWSKKMGINHLAKRQERTSKARARYSRCRPCSVI